LQTVFCCAADLKKTKEKMKTFWCSADVGSGKEKVEEDKSSYARSQFNLGKKESVAMRTGNQVKPEMGTVSLALKKFILIDESRSASLTPDFKTIQILHSSQSVDCSTNSGSTDSHVYSGLSTKL
jgi:hypothetical protein